MPYRKPFIAALAGIILMASIWLIYEQVREPAELFLFCPEGTENNGNNICLCSDPHTRTVTIDGHISCLMIGPDIPEFDLCTIVTDHPKCQKEKPGLLTHLPNDLVLGKENGKFCKDHPNHPMCNVGPVIPPGCGDQVDCE
jgi:hypothetical protein